MRTGLLNKILGTGGNKVTPEMNEAFDLHTAKMNAAAKLSPAEANAVGKAVALAAELNSVSPARRQLHERIGAVAAPTPAEQRAIDQAEAAWEAAHEATRQGRRVLAEAVEELREIDMLGQRGFDIDLRDLNRRREAVAAAKSTLDRAERAEIAPGEDLGRARGDAADAGRIRVREMVARGL